MHADTETDLVGMPDDRQYWYVMTHLEPALIDRQLQLENADRLSRGESALLYVIPFLYMLKAGVGKGADEEVADGKAAAENNSLRSSLHGFVFIKATPSEIRELTGREWNRQGRLHLYHYRTKSGLPIRACQEEMQPLLSFFIEQHQRFSFTPYGEELSSNETVYIRRGIFKDYRATVLEVRHLGSGVSLTLGIPLFNSEVLMKLYDYPVSEVEVPGRMEHLFEPQFVSAFESDLLGILRRRVLRHGSADMLREDLDRLNTYSLLHSLRFTDSATHAHFQSLLLLCATLRNDVRMKSRLIPSVMKTAGESGPPTTDESAFCMAVLFIATRSVDYRRMVRDYCRTTAVTSESLASIMPLVKKMRVRGA